MTFYRSLHLRLFWLGLGYLLIGIIMESYSMSVPILVATAGVLFYLVWSDEDGCFFSGLWATVLISSGVLQKSWINKMPVPDVQIVLGSLLIIWLFSLALILFSGQVAAIAARRKTRDLNKTRWIFFAWFLNSLLIGYGLSAYSF